MTAFRCAGTTGSPEPKGLCWGDARVPGVMNSDVARQGVSLHESGLHTGSGESYNGSVPPGIDTGGSVKRSGHTAREPWEVVRDAHAYRSVP